MKGEKQMIIAIIILLAIHIISWTILASIRNYQHSSTITCLFYWTLCSGVPLAVLIILIIDLLA